MTRIKLYLIVQTFLCVLLTILLSAGAIHIYREGSARKAEDPLAAVYTEENVAEQFAHAAPLLFITAGMTAAGLLLGVGDGKTKKNTGAVSANNKKSVVKKQTAMPIKSAGLPENQNVLRNILIVIAVIFIVAGIFNGSMQDVLVKASAVCSECIGLG